jgi:hypothetical protein
LGFLNYNFNLIVAAALFVWSLHLSHKNNAKFITWMSNLHFWMTSWLRKYSFHTSLGVTETRTSLHTLCRCCSLKPRVRLTPLLTSSQILLRTNTNKLAPHTKFVLVENRDGWASTLSGSIHTIDGMLLQRLDVTDSILVLIYSFYQKK